MKIAVYGQELREENIPYLKVILDTCSANNIELVLENGYLKKIQHSITLQHSYTSFESHTDLDSSFDFVLGLGGDGTMLNLITLVRDKGIPVVGINLGRMGFLSAIRKENAEQGILDLIQGNYTKSSRSLIEVKIEGDIELEFPYALNEIAILRKESTSMLSAEAKLNGEYLNKYWADGLIIATPTGSTGYSLSCGGPIIYPEANSFVITPIAPHNLNMRPFIIDEINTIDLKIDNRENEYLLTLDSRSISVPNNIPLTVRKAAFEIEIIYPNSNSYLETVRKKLYWGNDLRN